MFVSRRRFQSILQNIHRGTARDVLPMEVKSQFYQRTVSRFFRRAALLFLSVHLLFNGTCSKTPFRITLPCSDALTNDPNVL